MHELNTSERGLMTKGVKYPIEIPERREVEALFACGRLRRPHRGREEARLARWHPYERHADYPDEIVVRRPWPWSRSCGVPFASVEAVDPRAETVTLRRSSLGGCAPRSVAPAEPRAGAGGSLCGIGELDRHLGTFPGAERAVAQAK